MQRDQPKHVWLFDPNRRTYQRDADGKPYGAPIWRAHWTAYAIIGQTSRSWIIEGGRKIPKKGGQGILFDEAELDRRAYIAEHKHPILDAVRNCRDYHTLKRVADAIGYTDD
jgi:hypothetical protein